MNLHGLIPSTSGYREKNPQVISVLARYLLSNRHILRKKSLRKLLLTTYYLITISGHSEVLCYSHRWLFIMSSGSPFQKHFYVQLNRRACNNVFILANRSGGYGLINLACYLIKINDFLTRY